jgi:hypothetical protein
MSTLNVTTIKKLGETAGRDVSGVAAAWVNYDNSATVSIRGSVNVSSILDYGTGECAPQITSSFANINYLRTASSATNSSQTPQSIYVDYSRVNNNYTTPTVSEWRVTNLQAGTPYNAVDVGYVHTLAHGDLA